MAAPFTVMDAMIACGINNAVFFNGATACQRIATEIFDNDFLSCLDKSYTELDDSLKDYSALTVANGQIRLTPGIKTNVKAFIQWTRDLIRVGEDPSVLAFPVADAATLIRRYKTHVQFINKSSSLSDIAKPVRFTEKVHWDDRKPVFLNSLGLIRGRNENPLSCVCRPDAAPALVAVANTLEDYVARAPMVGDVFDTDNVEVHTYLVNFVAGNSSAEAKIIQFADTCDGRRAYIALRDHYEGVGLNSRDVLTAEDTLAKLFYSGEKKPHMWFAEFEKQLLRSFAIMDKRENRQVYSDAQKLRILVRKINVDFLQPTLSAINIEITKVPPAITFDEALASFCNAVNQKYPPEMSGTTRTRRINAVGRSNNGNGNGGRKQDKNKNNKGKNRHHNGNGKRASKAGAPIITGTDGKPIEIHPGYKFEPAVWAKIPQHEKDRMQRERDEFKRRCQLAATHTYYPSAPMSYGPPMSYGGEYGGGYGSGYAPAPMYNQSPPPVPQYGIGQVNSGGSMMVSPTPSTACIPPPPPPPPPRDSQYSGSIMGGRNEQAGLRSRNPSRLSTVVTRRELKEISKVPAVEEPHPGSRAQNEADTNADTCCLGTNFIVLRYTNRVADVYPYDKSYDPIQDVPIITGATAWTDHSNGETYILIFHEALYYGRKMGHSLINPNQIRAQGHDFWDNPFDRAHDVGIETLDGPTIPLVFLGTKCVFESSAPSREQLQNCVHIEMTSPLPWNPDEVQLMMGSIESRLQQQTPGMNLCTDDDFILLDIEPSLVCLKELSIKKLHTDDTMSDLPARRTFTSNERHRKLDAEALSENWMIGRKRAMDTINATTQLGTRSAITPLSRRYRADHYYGLKKLNTKFSTDTLYPDARSIIGNTHAQIYSNKAGFVVCYPMRGITGNATGQSLLDFSHDFGVPAHLTFDGYSSQVGPNTLFMKTIRKYNIQHHVSEPRRPNQNPVEGSIRDIKIRWYRIMSRSGAPVCVWDFGLVWTCETSCLSVSSSRYANGRTSMEIVTGETPDISEYLDFSFYEWVSFRTIAGLGETSIGRWLGVSHKVGNLMSYWILPISCRPVSCVTVQRLTEAEKATPAIQSKMHQFDSAVNDRLNTSSPNDLSRAQQAQPFWNRLSLNEDDPDFLTDVNRVIGEATIPYGPDDRVEELDSDDTEPLSEGTGAYVTWAPDVTIGKAETTQQANDTKPAAAANDDDDDSDESYSALPRLIPRTKDEDSSDDDDEHTSYATRHAAPSTPQNVHQPEPFFDNYIGMRFSLPHGPDGSQLHATVKRRRINEDGTPVGTYSSNPLTDTRKYEVEFLDGSQECLTANIIAENMLSQVDEEGHRQLLLSDIIAHRIDDTAVPNDKGWMNTRRGGRHRIKTTKGWEVLCEWKDGSSTWVELKDMKNAYPVDLARYGQRKMLLETPAFAWWAPYVLRKASRSLSKLKSKYWQRTHKYGIRVPKSVNEALAIDREEGNSLWTDAIKEEMAKVRVAFELYEDDVSQLVGHQQITTHMIFDVKLGENFRRKARLVADGHKTETPTSLTYSTVVSRDSVRICFLAAALNDLDIMSADIENAYLTAPCREKCWTIAGPEFREDEGKTFLIVRALYGLKSSGAAFRSHLAGILDDIGFKSSIADPDVWLRPAVKPDGEEYYEYMMCYVDDICCCSFTPKETIAEIQRYVKLKKNQIIPPDMYLGASIAKKSINGRDCWTMSSADYIKAAIENIEKEALKYNLKFAKKAITPIASGYIPEIDSSHELDANGITFFQECIGIF